MADGVQVVEQHHFHWRDAQVATELNPREWPREEPLQPKRGQGWYDDETENMYVWSGDDWVAVPKD